MKTLVVGLGIQGHKRAAIAGSDLVASVDPLHPKADYKTLQEVPLHLYDSALVCTPDGVKIELLTYLLSHGKNVLVEKPLLVKSSVEIENLERLARDHNACCYTAYNHRFEPHIVRLKTLLEKGDLGKVYLAKFFYGNGTARDVKLSNWKDEGSGVLPDLGSHLLDMILFLFGNLENRRFEPWSLNRFENKSYDHVFFASKGEPTFMLEATLLSWRNTFKADVFAENGSVHIDSLCKWGPSTLTIRKRKLPSGKPDQEHFTLECPDPTWAEEYAAFKILCKNRSTNLSNDRWISAVLNQLESQS